MYPEAPQLWKPEGNGVVGVSDDPPGETFWKVDNGIRLSGMPSYRKILNPTQEWQVALLSGKRRQTASARRDFTAAAAACTRSPSATVSAPAAVQNQHLPRRRSASK